MSKKINPEELKKAMRAWITGVAIVSGHHNGAVHGMTANSFNSIALSPPTVMVALRHHTRTQQLVSNGSVFGVSILNTEQVNLAKRFAGQTDTDRPRFEGVDTFTMVTHVPLIRQAMAFFDCKVVNSFDVGGTTVFLGEVLAAQNNDKGREPLLYINREWRRLAN
ncbi:MAG: flavin reductase family protein [Chloroflexota bacterium]|nr:flavin reductase family protein [Chloroflexota bacterium]